MDDNERLTLTRTVWREDHKDGPSLPPGQFGLTFAVRAAEGLFGPTVALLCNSRLPGRYGDLYGGRVPGATLIVVVNAVTAQVYVGRPDRIDSVPVRPARQTPGDPALGGMVLESVDTAFNVDLAGHLALPPDEARYQVFLWLDDVVSAVQTVLVPEAAERCGSPAPVPEAELPEDVRVFYQPARINQSLSGLMLAASRGQDGTGPIRVSAMIGRELLPTEPVLQGDDRPALTLLVLPQDDRVPVWRTLAIDPEQAAGQPVVVQLELFSIAPAPEVPQCIFILAHYGTTCSAVLTLEAPAWASSESK